MAGTTFMSAADTGVEGSAGSAAEADDGSEQGSAEEEGGGSETSSGELLDVGGPSDTGGSGGGPMTCTLDPDGSGTAPCTDSALPDSFDPDVQWTWTGDPWSQSITTPVVINLSDDDGDGELTICDTPDIVLTAYDDDGYANQYGYLFVLNGDDGSERFRIDHQVMWDTEPAAGDIDGDGWPEIIATESTGVLPWGRMVAFEHDGTLKWTQDTTYSAASSPIAIADLDGDGEVEVMAGSVVVRGTDGTTLHNFNDTYVMTTTAADLDEDGEQEIILGTHAYRADGSPYYDVRAEALSGHPHVADLDGDERAEVLIVGQSKLLILEDDGSIKMQQTIGQGVSLWRPAAIHDIDGDGQPEIALPADMSYGVYEANLVANWTKPSSDTGFASSTAFDFLGDATAEAMYADHDFLYIYDGVDGTTLLSSMRESWTQFESPVVADVDNDGSAEIVVISNKGNMGGTYPTVQVIRDVEDRWIPARRIWNQFTYHVSNIREDGTVPAQEPLHWKTTNSYRAQAQISSSGGGVCVPPVP